MDEGTVQIHNVGLTSFPLTSLSFHVNWASYSWVTTFSNFYLENQGARSWVGSNLKVTMWVSYPIDSHSFRSMSIGPPSPEIQYFQNLTLKIYGQGQMTMMLHNYRSRQFHRTSHGINPSSGFRDMVSAKYRPSAAWFDQFLAREQAHMGRMGKWLWRCTTTGLGKPWNFKWGKSILRFHRSAFCKVWAQYLCQIWHVFAPWASPYVSNGKMTMTVHN